MLLQHFGLLVVTGTSDSPQAAAACHSHSMILIRLDRSCPACWHRDTVTPALLNLGVEFPELGDDGIHALSFLDSPHYIHP